MNRLLCWLGFHPDAVLDWDFDGERSVVISTDSCVCGKHVRKRFKSIEAWRSRRRRSA